MMREIAPVGVDSDRGRLAPMSNQQWNSGSNEWGAQQGNTDWNQQGWQNQGSAQEWGQQAPAADWTEQPQPQGGTQEWGQPQPQGSAQEAPATDWNSQPQGSAQDWNQAQPQHSAQEAPVTDWNQQPAAGHDWQAQPSAQDWGQPAQPGAHDWNQQNQGWQQGGAMAPGGFPGQYNQAPTQAKGSPFDFSFKKLSLPGSASLIFILGVAAVAVEWLFSLISAVTAEYTTGMYTAQVIVGGLAEALFKILILRVLLEIGVALISRKNDDTPAV